MPPSAPPHSSSSTLPLHADTVDDNHHGGKQPTLVGQGISGNAAMAHVPIPPVPMLPYEQSAQYNPMMNAVSNNIGSMWSNNGMLGSSSIMNPYGGNANLYGMNGGMTPMMSPTVGPFSNITNYLLGLQNVIMSIGQVVQIISFNTSSLQQLCESMLAMFEHAVRTWNEQMQLSIMSKATATTTAEDEKNNQERQRQRKLRALRYAIVVAISYVGFTLIRQWRNRRRRRQFLLEYGATLPPPALHTQPPQWNYPSYPPSAPHQQSYSHYSAPPYFNGPQPQLSAPPFFHAQQAASIPYSNNNNPYAGGAW
jgi:hypothetical protein